ncbi:MAG: phage integrase N-terminal SAM-like domain-containing protein [Loktanella sp.]|nr:phage integrase N-terminal SAM-like domain-containing protein [Loktanella sp.]
MSEQHIPPLRRRFLEDMRIKGLQPKTQTMYLRAMRDFSGFLGHSPDSATPEELRAFQLDMKEKGIGAPTFNNRLTVLSFFYATTCPRPEMKRHMRYQRAAKKIWSFGGQLVSRQLDWGPTGTGLLWTCIGSGGLAGAFAGILVGRWGLDRVHWAFLGLMTASILAVGFGLGPVPVLIAGAIFGAAYVMLTGVYLIWGINALPDRPATGLMVGFLTIAVGQTTGAPVFGFMMAGFGPGLAVACFGGIALLAGFFPARGAINGAPA